MKKHSIALELLLRSGAVIILLTSTDEALGVKKGRSSLTGQSGFSRITLKQKIYGGSNAIVFSRRDASKHIICMLNVTGQVKISPKGKATRGHVVT